MKIAKLLLAFVMMTVAVSACGDDNDNNDNNNNNNNNNNELVNIVDTAVADGRFTTLVSALQAADLADTLKGTGPFTVFAPTDAAFNKLPAGTVETLLKPENMEQLQSVLRYHVLSGEVMAAKLITMTSVDTLADEPITVTVKDDKVFLNDTTEVILTDVKASNGVIHVIDAVLFAPKPEEPELEDIVDVAVADGRFTTLAAALEAADLVDTLKGDGPFTVFAPTDDAFATLPEGTLETLLEPENLEQLQAILLYHVLSGEVMAAELVTQTSVDSLNDDEPITVTVTDGNVFLNDTVQVILTDIEASNGVIHVIDGILMPPQ